MMAIKKPSLVVLEVGHGSAAVLLDTSGVVVVDAGQGGVLLDFLRGAGITVVDLLLISHTDSDHIRNAPDLLLDHGIAVRRVCFNSDADKNTQVWGDFRDALRYGRQKKDLKINAELTVSNPGTVTFGAVQVEILYPFPEIAASGPGGLDVDGNRITGNSMSAVVRLRTAAGPQVLLAGDSETACLDAWAAEKISPEAKVLVFPHHGGNPGAADPSAFAARLIQLVNPATVMFSIHRTQHELPLPGVVDAVRQHSSVKRVACTQLSARCANAAGAPGSHLVDVPRAGAASNCCAGSIVIDLSGAQPVVAPDEAQHQAYITSLGGTPLCRRPLDVLPPPKASGDGASCVVG